MSSTYPRPAPAYSTVRRRSKTSTSFPSTVRQHNTTTRTLAGPIARLTLIKPERKACTHNSEQLSNQE